MERFTEEPGLASPSGPIRCRKQGPGRAVPSTPPVVETLTPEQWSEFRDRGEWAAVVRHFSRGDYRACVEPLEALFFDRRNTLHQGLLQYSVALMQLRRGMVRSPRRLLSQTLALWRPYGDSLPGLDLAAHRAHAQAWLERLPEGVTELPLERMETLWCAPPSLLPDGNAECGGR